MKTNSILLLILISSSLVGPQLWAESLFDRYVAQNNGVVPFPFSSLRENFNQRAEENSLVSGGTVTVSDLLVPDGRSAQKSTSNFRDPRVLTSIETGEGRIFIGYSKNARQLEVISWNQETQSYDFQTVSNYSSGTTPNIHPAGTACISCHQNNGPIFTSVPWSESSDPEVLRRMRLGPPARTTYEGIPIPAPEEVENFTGAITYEAAANNGAKELRNANMCKRICGPDSAAHTPLVFQCRKSLLFLALNPMEGGTPPEQTPQHVDAIRTNGLPEQNRRSLLRYHAYQMVSSRIAQNLPADGFALPSFLIEEDRNPFKTYTNAEQLEQNPATPRGTTEDLDVGEIEAFFAGDNTEILKCLGMDYREVNALRDYGSQKLWDAINDSSTHDLVNTMPPKRQVLVRRLLDRMIADEEITSEEAAVSFTAYCGEFLRSVAPLRAQALDPLANASKAATNAIYPNQPLFNQYCSSCHGKDSGLELPLNSLRQLKSYGTGSPADRVVNRLNGSEGLQMPPASAPQPTETERALMIQTVQ